jgi:myo-inositol-1(or 4)-monophosphatase
MPPADGPAARSDADDSPGALRDLAAELAVEAGRVALAGRRAEPASRDLGGDTKSSATDIVTRFDRAAEESIVSTLARRRPGDGIVGEEGADVAGASGFVWLIDPIDGTTNFVYDLPAWCCSVAVARHGVTLAGAVYVPVLDELYSAALGEGATLDGRPIAPSAETDLARALVATGFSYLPDARRAHAAAVASLIGEVRDIRRMGSAAIDLCSVAAGRVDVYFERGLNPWDMAAGELIAREAGAITSDFVGGPVSPDALVVAAPGVHAAFLHALTAR